MNKNEVTHATKTITPASLIQHDMWQPHPTFTVLKTARTVSPQKSRTAVTVNCNSVPSSNKVRARNKHPIEF